MSTANTAISRTRHTGGKPEITRIFVVGCPRSGTTLLQSLLAANSQVVSFPETHFFDRLFSDRLLFNVLGLASWKAQFHWNVLVTELGHPEFTTAVPGYAIFWRQYAHAYVHMLDTLTLAQDKTIWVEKTPEHLDEVDRIEKIIHLPKFVHIVRPGIDNIASLYAAGQKYPETWQPWYATIDQCIDAWVEDARKSLSCSSRANHRVVMYEELVSTPQRTLTELCAFLGLPFEESMLSDYAKAASQVSHKWEEWKSAVFGPIKASKSKFYEVFSEQERQYILAQIPEDLQFIARPQNNAGE